ncbi:MAG TPA: PKD-like domain-containing protein, partial [Chitinophagaceae bacterium]
MRKFYLLFLLFGCCFFTGKLDAQCTYDPTATIVNVDLSAKADTIWVLDAGALNISRNDGACGDNNCIVFIVTVNPSTTEVGFNVANPAPPGSSAYYQLDCGGLTSLGTPLCVSGKTTFCITFCKPGNDKPDYTISASRGFGASENKAVRVGGVCNGLMYVTGLTESTIAWTSVAPGAAGAYNSNLTPTPPTKTDTVNYTATTVPPGGYIDYEVSGTKSGCAVGTLARDTVRMYVYPALTVSISPNTPIICTGGGSIQLTATASGGNSGAGYTYSWTGPGGFTSTIRNPTVSTPGTYQVAVTDSTDCNPVTASVTISSSPTPNITSASTGTACSGVAQNYTITADVVGTTYSWSRAAVAGISNAAVSGQTSNPITEALINTTTSPIAVQYQITPTANGCPGPVFTYTVTVNPTPVVTTANTATVCSGISTNINLSATVTSTYTWTIGTITGSITGAAAGSGAAISQVLTNPSTTTAGTVQYLVTPTSSLGCVGSAYTITVTVNPAPVLTSATTSTICSGSATNIPLTASVASNFAWTIGTITGGITGATAASGATIAQTLTNPSNSTAGTVAYSVTPTSSLGCVGTPSTVTVTVNPIPAVTTANTSTICSGTATNIALTASAPSNFTWTVGTISGG